MFRRLGASLTILVAAASCSKLGDDLFANSDGAAGCPTAADGGATVEPMLSSIQANIFDPICTQCHPTSGLMDLRSGTSFAELVNMPAEGNSCLAGDAGAPQIRVVPMMPEESLLYQKLVAKQMCSAAPCGEPMPQGPAFPPLPDDQIEAIRQWIMAGAEDN